MKPQKPRTPRQELEASLTALLLGELSVDKAAALRELMAKDQELARLYERLEQTIGLVRETAVPEQGAQSAPLKLSTKRREQLLQHFKTIAPKEFAKPKRRAIEARELGIAAGIVAFIGMAAWLMFNQTQHASKSSMSQVDVLESGRGVTEMVAKDVEKLVPPSTVASVTEQPIAFQSVQGGVVMAGGGGGGGMGSHSQTIFNTTSAGKPIANQIVLPTATDYEMNDAVSPSTSQPGATYSTYDATVAAPALVNSGGQKPAANDSLGLGQQNDEMLRRQSGGLAWSDNMHSKNGDLGLAEAEAQQIRRSKLREAVRNSSENKPAEKIPAIDPATGLPSGGYVNGIDPATGLPIPAEVAEAQEKIPAPVLLATRTFQVDTNSFLAAIEPFKDAASQMPNTAGGTGGGGGAGGRGPATASATPARTLHEPALAPAQTPAATSTPVAGEKLAELAHEGKDASGSNIYLGKELAKADVKFGTWGLETGQGVALPRGTKNEEEKLKQVGEIANGVTIAGRATTPGKGFSLIGPREPPAPPVGPLQPQAVPRLGDLAMPGKAFDSESLEDKPGLSTATPAVPPAVEPGLLASTNGIQPWARVRGDVAAVSGAVKVDEASSALDWSFQTGTSNRGWIGHAGEPKVTLTGITPLPSNSFAFRVKEAGKGESYDRYTSYRNLEQLGTDGDKETKLALSYSNVTKEDRKAGNKRTAGEIREEILPPGTIDFRGADLNQVLDLYSQLSGRRILAASNLASPTIVLEQKKPLTKSEAVRALDAALGLNGIAIVDIGDKFAKAAPSAAAGQMGAPYKESEKSTNDGAKSKELVTHVMQVDTNVFRQGLESINTLTVSGFTVAGGAGSGVRAVTRTNDMATVQTDVRKFFKTMGVDLNGGDGKSVFYNDRDGTLLVRGTREDVDLIEGAISVLNTAPPPVTTNKDQFVDSYALGGMLDTNGRAESAGAGVPHPYARTNVLFTGRGWEIVSRKLDKIMVDSLKYEGLPLSEVVQNLNEEAKKHDPERRGITFILNPDQIAGSVNSTVPGGIDPATGLPMTPATGAIDLGAASVKILPELRDVRLADVLDAIVKTSDKPIKYSIEDYGVVFSRAGTKADWEDSKVPAKPVTPPLIPQPEVQTRENAFSTFSLNVSDVAFKLAGASLEKGLMPEAGSIRSEEFINAFDYRDPEAPAGVPVAFAWERARYPYAQNRDLLRFSIKTAAQGRQAGRPLNLVLLMDNSGSMERADRVAIIREALNVLASQLQPRDKLSVITFARTAQLRVDGVAGNLAAQVAEDIGGLTPEGGTNIEEAMNLAYQTALRHYLANGINRVVLLTDGAANLGNVEPESLKQKVEANRKQGIALDCFGIGWEGFNDDLLETLSRNGDGRYGFINSPEEAATEFAGQLAGALNVAASDVKVQVEFNPARVTAYRQIGYAKHQLTKEQFRDNTVDAAEIAAQEAGNALYVVEVNPAGQGPLGTVRVRFKIPGTSDYREHEWTVPFNGNAVALEQASPAMRLAATASAFSEWLASSPYATEVTPDTLLRYLSGVPEVYGADGRPKKLEWMIRQAKSVAGGEIRNSTTDEH